MANLFNGYIDSYEMLDFLSDKLQDELNRINHEKKRSISSWTDTRYTRYDEQRYVIKQYHKYLQSLYKELEKAELLDDIAREGTE
jgi:3-methyladenine DNA glycosylase AlkC